MTTGEKLALLRKKKGITQEELAEILLVDSILQDKLEAKGAVLIRRPKWCGKTTTTVQKAASMLKMDNPETKEQNLDMARLSPLRLLRGDVPRLIDEWQLAHSL